MIIVHIAGLTGSGKTSLGKRLSKFRRIKVIDTDDIDDPNRLKYGQNKTSRKGANKKDMMSVIKSIGDNEILVAVGHLFPGIEEALKPRLTDKYFIKIDPETLFRQYNLRTLDSLIANSQKIKALLSNKNIKPIEAHELFSHQFKIRNGFDCRGVKDIKKQYKKAVKTVKEKGYKVMTSDEIYFDIKDTIL